MKRSPIKRKSPTAAIKKLQAERAAWAAQFTKCWGCGCRGTGPLPLHTHEIVRRSETADWMHPANFTRLCLHCHDECHGGWLTKDILLTLKLLFDPDAYNPEWIREHAIKRHWEPAPLPELCRWFINT